jgi:hypothetical protein
VRGKEGILFRLAEAALEQPDEIVRRALYPVVGEATLRDLVREARANQAAFRQRVGTVLRSSYSGHYRRLLGPLLATPEFRSNNSAFRPVMDALDLLRRYSLRPGQDRWYDEEERVPIDDVVPSEWWEAVVDEQGRVERIPYELCVLKALRDAIRRREVYVVGGNRWRNPEEDLPGDFELTLAPDASRPSTKVRTFGGHHRGLSHGHAHGWCSTGRASGAHNWGHITGKAREGGKRAQLIRERSAAAARPRRLADTACGGGCRITRSEPLVWARKEVLPSSCR